MHLNITKNLQLIFFRGFGWPYSWQYPSGWAHPVFKAWYFGFGEIRWFYKNSSPD